MDLAQAIRARTGKTLRDHFMDLTELAIMATDIAEVIGLRSLLYLFIWYPTSICCIYYRI